MEINRKMNLVVPVETESGTVYVHSTPLSKEAYQESFMVLAKTYSRIFSEGLGIMSGPRVAYMVLKDVSGDNWEGTRGVRNTLVNEIIRISNVVMPEEGKGWCDMPLEEAISKGLIDEDDVLGEITFFICVCAVNKPKQAIATMTVVSGLWDCVLTLENVTGYRNSLPISSTDDSTGETETILSVPS